MATGPLHWRIEWQGTARDRNPLSDFSSGSCCPVHGAFPTSTSTLVRPLPGRILFHGTPMYLVGNRSARHPVGLRGRTTADAGQQLLKEKLATLAQAARPRRRQPRRPGLLPGGTELRALPQPRRKRPALGPIWRRLAKLLRTYTSSSRFCCRPRSSKKAWKPSLLPPLPARRLRASSPRRTRRR